MSEETKKTNVSVGCTSWAGAFLTAVIIAIRAFQPNAAPMETWSVSSWCLMALPLVLPLVLWIGVILGGLVCVVLSALSDN